MTSRKKSDELFYRASVTIPGAVNSPVRAWKAVGAAPIFIESGSGATLIDADGVRFLDFVCSYGPAILGHGDPRVIAAISEQARHGLGFGAPTRVEVELAEMISAVVISSNARFSETERRRIAITMAGTKPIFTSG